MRFFRCQEASLLQHNIDIEIYNKVILSFSTEKKLELSYSIQ